MDNHDEQFEKYLGEFQPRRPRALPTAAISKQLQLRRLAAAAAILIALGTSLWFVRRKRAVGGEFVATNTIVQLETKPVPRTLSLLGLTQLALRDPGRLDVELSEASRRVLPDFRANDSTLRVLAKE